jgi:hypothetical protein
LSRFLPLVAHGEENPIIEGVLEDLRLLPILSVLLGLLGGPLLLLRGLPGGLSGIRVLAAFLRRLGGLVCGEEGVQLGLEVA